MFSGWAGICMLELKRKIYNFNIKDIWWADEPYDVDNCASVTFHASKSRGDIKGFSREEFTTLVIDLTQELDQIWNNMNKYNRRDINKAKKSGFEIKINENYDEFYKINNQFTEDKGIDSYLINVEFMKKYGTLFTAEFNGETVGGHFYLADKDNIRCLIGSTKRLSVSKEEARLLADANRLLLWEAIVYAKNEGIKRFDLGGYYTGKKSDPQKESINTFKKSFGGQLFEYDIYQKNYSTAYRYLKSLYDLKSRK